MKSFFTALLVVLVFPSVQGQDGQDPNFRLGIKVAPNLAWLRADSKDLESNGTRSGISFGLLSEFKIDNAGRYFFATGILYNNIGGKFNAEGTYTLNGVETAVRTAQDVKLRYIELPLTIKLRSTVDRPLNFYGQVGAGLALNVRARADATTTTTVGGSSTTTELDGEDVIDDIAFFKMGLLAGAGAEYEMAAGTILFAGLTYNTAFTNVLDGDAKSLSVSGKKSKLFAEYFELTLGVFL